MTRIQGRSPSPRELSAGRRNLRRAVTTQAAARPTARPRWRVPPVVAFALVMLVLSALVALVGGVTLMGQQPLVAVCVLLYGLLAVASAWSFGRGEKRGYWSAVVLLGLIGAVPAGFAIAAGSVATGVVLVPPLVMAGILLQPRVRAQLITRRSPEPQPGPAR
jgi:hypothetical protein